MKQLFTLLAAVLFTASSYAQVGIGTTTPEASAALDITSTTKGLLPPRVTEAQRDAISTAAAGLIVYCTDCGANGEPQFYNGASWVNMVGGAAAVPLPTSTVFIEPGVSKVFLAHNLGADTALNAHTPVQGIHGNYYQWGSSAIVADASTPADAIGGWNTTTAANGAWADGSKTVNDPCPVGFRVPTQTQWDGVIANNTVSRTSNNAWTEGNANFGSAIHWRPDLSTKNLTLPAAGYRHVIDGLLRARGTYGGYWSSTQDDDTLAYNLDVDSSDADTDNNNHAYGFSVRCVSE